MRLKHLFSAFSRRSDYRDLDANEFEEHIAHPQVVLVDVRTLAEFLSGHLSEAIHIDVSSPDFTRQVLNRVPQDKPVALYCRSGARSANAAEILSRQGYRVSNLTGGIISWQAHGKSVAR